MSHYPLARIPQTTNGLRSFLWGRIRLVFKATVEDPSFTELTAAVGLPVRKMPVAGPPIAAIGDVLMKTMWVMPTVAEAVGRETWLSPQLQQTCVKVARYVDLVTPGPWGSGLVLLGFTAATLGAAPTRAAIRSASSAIKQLIEKARRWRRSARWTTFAAPPPEAATTESEIEQLVVQLLAVETERPSHAEIRTGVLLAQWAVGGEGQPALRVTGSRRPRPVPTDAYERVLEALVAMHTLRQTGETGADLQAGMAAADQIASASRQLRAVAGRPLPQSGVVGSAAASATVAPDAIIGEQVYLGARVQIGVGARILPQTFVGDGAVIGAGVTIGPRCWIGPGAQIGDNSVIQAWSRVGAKTKIGAGVGLGTAAAAFRVTSPNEREMAVAFLDRYGADDGVQVGDGVRIGAGSETGDAVRIGDRSTLNDNVQISSATTLGAEVRVGQGAKIHGESSVGAGAIIPVDARVPRLSYVEPGTTWVKSDRKAADQLARVRQPGETGAVWVLRRIAELMRETGQPVMTKQWLRVARPQVLGMPLVQDLLRRPRPATAADLDQLAQSMQAEQHAGHNWVVDVRRALWTGVQRIGPQANDVLRLNATPAIWRKITDGDPDLDKFRRAVGETAVRSGHPSTVNTVAFVRFIERPGTDDEPPEIVVEEIQSEYTQLPASLRAVERRYANTRLASLEERYGVGDVRRAIELAERISVKLGDLHQQALAALMRYAQSRGVRNVYVLTPTTREAVSPGIPRSVYEDTPRRFQVRDIGPLPEWVRLSSGLARDPRPDASRLIVGARRTGDLAAKIRRRYGTLDLAAAEDDGQHGGTVITWRLPELHGVAHPPTRRPSQHEGRVRFTGHRLEWRAIAAVLDVLTSPVFQAGFDRVNAGVPATRPLGLNDVLWLVGMTVHRLLGGTYDRYFSGGLRVDADGLAPDRVATCYFGTAHGPTVRSWSGSTATAVVGAIGDRVAVGFGWARSNESRPAMFKGAHSHGSRLTTVADMVAHALLASSLAQLPERGLPAIAVELLA